MMYKVMIIAACVAMAMAAGHGDVDVEKMCNDACDALDGGRSRRGGHVEACRSACDEAAAVLAALDGAPATKDEPVITDTAGDDGDDMPSTAEIISDAKAAEAACALESVAAAALANAGDLADAVADGADAVADAVGDALANGGNALCEAAKTAKSQGSATCDAVPDMKDMCLAAFDTAIDFACTDRSRRGGHGGDDDKTMCENLADMLTEGARLCSGKGRRVRLRRGGHGDMCDVAKTAKAQGAATCDAVPEMKDMCLSAFDTAIAFACDGAVPTIEFAGGDGDDDDMDDMGMEAMQCMMGTCGAEMGACMADSTCTDEMDAGDDSVDDNVFPTEAEFKAEMENAGPKFASFLQCMWDNCVAGMVAEVADQAPKLDASVCALVAKIAKNPTISAALEDAGADLSSIKEGAAAGSSDSAVSTTAQLVTVAVAAAVALVW